MFSCFEVLDIAYTIIGPDVSGEIQSAGITLRAPLICFDRMRIEPMLSKLSDEFKYSKKHRFYRHELDDRHTSHCTESATTGEIVYTPFHHSIETTTDKHISQLGTRGAGYLHRDSGKRYIYSHGKYLPGYTNSFRLHH
jgi:hypothetical protein